MSALSLENEDLKLRFDDWIRLKDRRWWFNSYDYYSHRHFVYVFSQAPVRFVKLWSSVAFLRRTPYQCYIQQLLCWRSPKWIILVGIQYLFECWLKNAMLYHSVLSMHLFIISLSTCCFTLTFSILGHIINRFRNDTRELPVLWHQALLSFVQNYRQDISTGMKNTLFL